MAQSEALSLAIKGHSFVMTGSCGTGKTYTLRHIVKTLSESKSVAVTATTGMASLQLGMHASTLHHWAGIGDGRHSLEKLAELFDNDDKFASAKQRILSSECLVIDEISMLSQRTFEMVEFVCRHVKRNNLCFGGMQVIGCGDFKQLPPVPNKYLNDAGEYSFCSPLFDIAFPHHVQLLKVIRQTEKDLAVAVQELCDGSPSPETIQLLRSLNERLEAPDDQISRLYGTNFDVRFVNEQMLDALEGNVHVFRANDEGNKNLLFGAAVPKTLLLKEGAPVILVKNLGGRLFNGQRGFVHKLEDGSPPVINFDGKLHELKPEKFEIFDASLNKALASRTQIPIVLSFAMTVHRAQGQTIENVEVDCSTFFAPGQMGVAVGRAVSKKGLRIYNFNIDAATMKHPDSVYSFYKKSFKALTDDLSCCNKIMIDESVTTVLPESSGTRSSPMDSDNDSEQTAEELPRSNCPFEINEFIDLNQSTEFISILTPELIASEQFKYHLEYLNFKVDTCFSDGQDTNKSWVQTYKTLNEFLVSKQHLKAIKGLFNEKNITKAQNKFSSKLSFWLFDKKVQKKTESVLSKQTESLPSKSNTEQISDAANAKLRYISGVCVHKIRHRLRASVDRNLGSTSKSSKLTRILSYKKEKMLKQLQTKEDNVDPNDPSMIEIASKQNKSHGLTIVNDEVFVFFKDMNKLLQSLLTTEHIHLHLDSLHNYCRAAVDSNNNLFSQWIGLFNADDEDSLEDELFLDLVAELFKSVTEHFVRLTIVDALQQFKRQIPRKKKQALRTKIQALGERQSKRKKTDTVVEGAFICSVCDTVCEEEPSDPEQSSIGCDKCNKWFHYVCVGLTGNEAFLRKTSSTWFCSTCSKKGKGKGKKTKQ